VIRNLSFLEKGDESKKPEIIELAFPVAKCRKSLKVLPVVGI